MCMNIWQDGAMDDRDDAVRTISDVETLKALADPLRLRLLATMMRTVAGELPVMSVKELATALGEPQTKLYRHVKQLEAAGLIRAAASRLVSGIVEQRYQACQRDLALGPGLTDSERTSASMEAAVSAVFDLYRSRFFAADRAGLIDPAASSDREPNSKPMLGLHESRLPPAKAAEIRERLQQILDDLAEFSAQDDADPHSVQVNVLVGYFSTNDAST